MIKIKIIRQQVSKDLVNTKTYTYHLTIEFYFICVVPLKYIVNFIVSTGVDNSKYDKTRSTKIWATPKVCRFITLMNSYYNLTQHNFTVFL